MVLAWDYMLIERSGLSIFYNIVEYNIEVALGILNQLTDNTKFKEMNTDIATAIINAIHSIGDYYERLDSNLITKEEDLWLRAFLYVNNQIKHDKTLVIIYFPVCGSMFPMSFPMRYGPTGVSWKNFEDNSRKNSRGKREYYDEYLCDKYFTKLYTGVTT